MDGKGSEKHWRACTRLGLAAAGLTVGLTLAVAAAQEAAVAPVGEEGFPTVDRRAEIAPNAEFDYLRALARGTGRVRVIVGLRVTFTPEGALSPAAQEAQHRAIASAGAAVRGALSGADYRVTHAFDLVPLIALALSEEALTRLQSSGLAATLWIDTPRAPPALAQGANREAKAVVGRGVAVAILDTGVDRADRSLGNAKVVSEACFSANGNCPYGDTQQLGAGAGRPCTYASSGCQHGTHVGAMATGRGADIIAIQVFSRFSGGQCKYEAEDPCELSFESDNIAGLEHVFRLHNNFAIGAASLSLGTGLFTLGCNDNPLKLAVDNLRSVGIATLIPSGNGGLRDAAEAPGCISSAMTVPEGDKNDVAAPANPKPASTALPDLVVTSGLLQSANDYTKRNNTVDFDWEHTTKNIGQATARASQTGVRFLNSLGNVLLGTLPVPRLRPGKQRSGLGSILEDFTDLYNYGTYKTKICADVGNTVKEGKVNEKNNCIKTAPFYVIPTVLRGKVEGSWAGIKGAPLSWSGALEFDFNKETTPGAFSYVLKPQPLTFTLSGTDPNGCTWSGTAEWDPTPSTGKNFKLALGPTDTYESTIIAKNFIFPGNVVCPGSPSLPFPIDMSGQAWLDTGGPKPVADPGFTFLDGESTVVVSTFQWNLDALDE